MELIFNSKRFGVQKVLIDDSDYDLIKEYSWHITKGKHTYYVMGNNPETSHRLFMHRLILNADRKFMVDHKDGNGLNNQRSNIRLATATENARNKRSIKKSKAGYRGVYKMAARKRMYGIVIGVDYGQIPLGYCADLILAALIYNEAAMKYHGEFAQLNNLTPKQIAYAESIRNVDGMISKPRNNMHGVEGVYKRRDTKKDRYDVKIRVNGKKVFVGGFDTKEEAADAYQKAKQKYKAKI